MKFTDNQGRGRVACSQDEALSEHLSPLWGFCWGLEPRALKVNLCAK